MKMLNNKLRIGGTSPLRDRRAIDTEERQKWYHSRKWQDLRAVQLTCSPFCVSCLAQGRHVHATTVDHIVSHALPGWRSRFFDLENLQSLCTRCHNAKTREERPDSSNYPKSRKT